MPETLKLLPRPCSLRAAATALMGVCALLLLPLPALAQLSVDIRDPDPSQPWHLSADRIATQQDIELAEAWGSVLLSKESNTLQADYARYYWTTQWVYLEGNVRAHWGGDYLEAEEAEFDLENQVGWLKNGLIHVQDPYLTFKGDRLEKTGPQTYTFDTATITSCDGPVPDWSIRADRGEITVDGYARLHSTRFLVRDHPIAYSPYLLVPVKTTRQSGFLLPEFSVSSQLGAGVNLPYFHVIDEEQDMTVYINGMSERGLMLGGEYRHTPNLNTKGWWRADWLYDVKTAPSETDEDSQFKNDGLVRPNHNRYWLRSKFNSYFPRMGMDTKLDIDLVSDQNYLREFEDGISGYEETYDTLLDEFGRDIDDSDDLTRTSVWTLSRNWTDFGLQSRVEYTQNLRYMNDNLDAGDDPTLQRLPELNANFYKTRLYGTPLEWEARNELTYFWRRRGTTGTRIDLHPQLSLPLISRFGALIPKVGWRETLYLVDRYEDSPPGVDQDDSFQDRGLFDLELQAYTDMFRVYDLDNLPIPAPENAGQSRWTRVKHDLRPELTYNYIPDRNQASYPLFDSLDRIEHTSMITASLSNVFTWRRDTVLPLAGDEDSFGLKTDYLDFLRVRLEQRYDFTEDSRDEDLDRFPQRPFSDLLLEVEVKPSPWFSLWNRTWYSHYSGTITEHEHFLQAYFSDRGTAYFGLDFRSDLSDDIWRWREVDETDDPDRFLERLSILRLGGEFALNPIWTVRGAYHHDLEEDERIKTEFGVTYHSQCWSADALFSSTQDDHRLEFRINLLELGSLGSSVQTGSE